jgi:hypothetical protein
MKSKVMLLCIPFILFFALAATAQEQEKQPEQPEISGPHIVIDSLEYNFGEVKAGTALNHTFEFENQGTDTLRVHSVKASCGCTTTKYDKVIAPEEKGEVTLAIADTKNYHGPIVKSATVSTNDPHKPSFRLTLRANFKKE